MTLSDIWENCIIPFTKLFTDIELPGLGISPLQLFGAILLITVAIRCIRLIFFGDNSNNG